MKIEFVKLSQIKVNEANPRSINATRFAKLVNSLLVFPKMLELRPIVVTSIFDALGGNMRYLALDFISKMSDEELEDRLEKCKDDNNISDVEFQQLLEYWLRWKDDPKVPVMKANELSDAKQREFIIKDNVNYGEWDYDKLANEWDETKLDVWGVDVWQPDKGETASNYNGEGDKPQKDLSDQIHTEYKVEVTCNDESEQENLYNDLTEKGYICRILTL